MNMKPFIPIFFAAILMAACDIESKNCPRTIEVPFESVEIPDSVKAGEKFMIDMHLFDYGCYQTADAYGNRINRDTIHLLAFAKYDECGCPAKSANLECSYGILFDTSARNTIKHFFYMQVNASKDSAHVVHDSVVFY